MATAQWSLSGRTEKLSRLTCPYSRRSMTATEITQPLPPLQEGRPDFPPAELVTLSSGNAFEEKTDSRYHSLYRRPSNFEYRDLTIEFVPPGARQVAAMRAFFESAFTELIGTEQERQRMSQDKKWEKISILLSAFQVDTDSLTGKAAEDAIATKIKLINAMFSNVVALDFLFEVLQDCFPDLHCPEWLAEDVLFELTTHVSNEVNRITAGG